MKKTNNANNSEFENLTRDSKEIIDTLKNRIDKGEFLSKNLSISEILEDETETEVNSYYNETSSEYDFDNDTIEGFDMKKFNEEFNRDNVSDDDARLEFIDDVEGLNSILEDKEKYKDYIDEAFPGFVRFQKSENQESDDDKK